MIGCGEIVGLGCEQSEDDPMNTNMSFSDAVYDEETHLAERELSAFVHAVTELYGPEQARFSAEDWLDESKLMDSAPRSESRDWRAVTIAASARLANRLSDSAHDQISAATI